jgi:hypothetical protein
MKLSNKVILGSFLLLVLFATFSFNLVAAQGGTPMNVDDADTYQGRLNAFTQYNFRFRLRTQLRINSTTDIDVNIECDALNIGDKEFELEVDAPHDLQMNMTCTEEQAELGLLNGNSYQIRNRNRYRYEEGFCLQIDCNCTEPLYAKLKIKATNQNQVGAWAYYDETTGEWVSVPTTIEDGFLVAETTHFSIWTILIPDYTLVIGISIGVGVAVLITVVSIIYIRKRKRTS